VSKLDLHGIRHSDVDRLVENFILMNQRDLPLEIVCGNSDRMISLVLNVTRRLGCEISTARYGTVIVRNL
jgi:hypothetical protein